MKPGEVGMLTEEQVAEIRARCEAAMYDHEHDCDEHEYALADGRCYHSETGEMCRYEPKCHDANTPPGRPGRLKPRLVSEAAVLADARALLAARDEQAAENARLREELKAQAHLFAKQGDRQMGLEVEIERLRADAEQWREHERGVMRASEQGMAELARLAALTQEATDE